MEAHFALLTADSREAVRGGNNLRRLEDQTSRGLDADSTTGFEAASRPAGAAFWESVLRGCYLSSMTVRVTKPTNLSLGGGWNEIIMAHETLRRGSAHLATPRAAVDVPRRDSQAFTKRCDLHLCDWRSQVRRSVTQILWGLRYLCRRRFLIS